jgi:hypothetical protein
MAFFDRQDDRARLRPQRAQTCRPTLLGLFECLVIPDEEGQAPDPQGEEESRADEPHTTG